MNVTDIQLVGILESDDDIWRSTVIFYLAHERRKSYKNEDKADGLCC